MRQLTIILSSTHGTYKKWVTYKTGVHISSDIKKINRPLSLIKIDLNNRKITRAPLQTLLDSWAKKKKEYLEMKVSCRRQAKWYLKGNVWI